MWRYSPEELHVFYAACAKSSADSMKRQAIAVRMGVNADKTKFKKFMDDLDGNSAQRKGFSQEFFEHLKALQDVSHKRRGSPTLKRPSAPKKD